MGFGRFRAPLCHRRRRNCDFGLRGTGPMDRDDGVGVTRQISECAAALAYEALPPELVELTKQIVLDTLGVTVGASGLAPEARIIADYVEALGGRPESL